MPKKGRVSKSSSLEREAINDTQSNAVSSSSGRANRTRAKASATRQLRKAGGKRFSLRRRRSASSSGEEPELEHSADEFEKQSLEPLEEDPQEEDAPEEDPPSKQESGRKDTLFVDDASGDLDVGEKLQEMDSQTIVQPSELNTPEKGPLEEQLRLDLVSSETDDPGAATASFPNNLALGAVDINSKPSADVFHDAPMPLQESAVKPAFDYSNFDAGAAFDFASVDVFRPPTPEVVTPRTPPVVGKMYLVPRDYKRCYTMEVEDITREVRVYPNGRSLGAEAGKFVGCVPNFTGERFYSVPWDSRRVMELNILDGEFREFGDDLGSAESKYGKAVASLGFHGRMYAPPCKAQRVLEIDPAAGTAREVGPKLGAAGMSKWFAAACSLSTRRIYAVPYDAERVLEIDPNRNGQAREIGPNLGKTRGKYMCVACASSGCLFAAPLNANHVLMIDLKGNVSLVGEDLGEVENKYSDLIVAPNKLLYAPPLRADRALEIQPMRGDANEIGPSFGAGESKWACGCVAYNGFIYCPPLEARRVLEIRPDFHEVQEIGCDLGIEDVRDEKYACIARSPVNNRLYAAPREAHFILEIDPDRGFVREVGIELGRIERKFAAIVTGPDTRLP